MSETERKTVRRKEEKRKGYAKEGKGRRFLK